MLLQNLYPPTDKEDGNNNKINAQVLKRSILTTAVIRTKLVETQTIPNQSKYMC
jgi:hypothetical protein